MTVSGAAQRLLFVSLEGALADRRCDALQKTGMTIRRLPACAPVPEAVAEFCPDVLLLHIKPEFCRIWAWEEEIRRDPDNIHLPIVWLGTEDAEEQELARLDGMVDEVLPASLSDARLAAIVGARAARSRSLSSLYRRQRAALLEKERRQAILDRHASITVTDLDGVILYANDNFCAVSGYACGELIGQNHRLVKSGRHPESFYRDLWQTISSGGTWEGRVCNRRKDGSFYWVQATVMPLLDEEGRPYRYMSVRTNITEIVEKEIRLEQYQQAMEIATDGKAILDGKGKHVYTNPAYARIYGYDSPQDLIGKSWRLLCPPEDCDQSVGRILAVLAKQGRWQGERNGRRKNGEAFPQYLSIAAMADGCSVCEVRDISRKKKQEAALKEAKTVAERANQAKSEFLSSMSHELRTPLNAILGLAQLLSLDNLLLPQQRENAQKIERAGRHLLALISDVLDFSKIEAGRMTVSLAPVSLYALIEECLALVKPMTEERGLSLRADSDCHLTPWADHTRLKQVLVNLLSNAAKYNRPGGSIELSCVAIDNGKLRISVQDTGKGIAPERMASLFQPFNRLGAETSKIEGSGIGLVITQRLIEMMEGTLGVESTPGLGSTFWIELRSAVACPPATKRCEERFAGPLRPGLPENTACKPRILVAEDNPANQDVIRQQLDLLGYEVGMADNGREALTLWSTGAYPLLLTDCHMPEMDGYELTQAIRQAQAGGGTRTTVIAFTADALMDERKRCFASGMDDILQKPVDLHELERVLNRWREADSAAAGARQRERLPKATAAAPSAHGPEAAAIDPSVLSKLVGDDPAVLRRLMGKFLESARANTLAIQDACNARRATAIAAAAHKLKSSARSTGAFALANLCQTLEQTARSAPAIWTDTDALAIWPDIDALAVQLPELLAAVETAISEWRQGATNGPEPARPVVKASFCFDPMRLLVVDDDPFMLAETVKVLEQLGIQGTVAVDNANKALALLDARNGDYDAVLCDLCMPDIDGVEFLRHLAMRRFRGGIIPISGTEPQILEAVGELARAHGLNLLGTLHKPFTTAGVAEALRRLADSLAHESIEKPAPASVTEDELRKGLSENALTVYYQPKAAIGTRQVIGVEALARWNHPRHGLLEPAGFIPLAESLGLIDPLTDTVCAMALRQGAEWRALGLPLKVAVNISALSLCDLTLPDRLARQIATVGLNPADVIVEITETCAIKSLVAGLEVLSRIRLLGMALSIDDFGTGYAALTQLKGMPFTELKIDRSFVTGAAGNAAARSILASSAELGKKLRMSIVAEGVESKADWDIAQSVGCDQAQGFWIAAPMPGGQITGWIRQWTSSI